MGRCEAHAHHLLAQQEGRDRQTLCGHTQLRRAAPADRKTAGRGLKSRPARGRRLGQSLRKLSWQALQLAPAGPMAALRASRLPVLAAATTLASSAWFLSAASLNLALSFQISGLARVSRLSEPSTNAAHGS